MPSPHLLDLPVELRDHIWDFVFHDSNITPFKTNNRDWFFYPSRQKCLACLNKGDDSFPYSKEVLTPLISCKQIYAEGYPIFLDRMRLHITKPSDLEDIRQSSRTALRFKLRQLKLTVHLNDNNREQWRLELRALPATFPKLEHVEIRQHMRPPIGFRNLSDAVYIAGPVALFPKTLIPLIQFAYIEDDEMFSTEELGTIYYHDALETHGLVMKALIDDKEFQDLAKDWSLEPMINRLMRIAQMHEEPWLEGIRRSRREQAEASAGL
jgi:hypothetical protein